MEFCFALQPLPDVKHTRPIFPDFLRNQRIPRTNPDTRSAGAAFGGTTQPDPAKRRDRAINLSAGERFVAENADAPVFQRLPGLKGIPLSERV